MGVKLKNLVQPKQVLFDDLKGKVLAVDTFNMLYQFLTTILQRDGRPLMNHEGRVTSHLNGLFYRSTKFMEHGLKLVFVFDGKPPALKFKESERRTALKTEAAVKMKEAEERGDIGEVRKYASRTARLTSEMITESKELLTLLGLPFIQAPSEGEAQAAFMTRQGDAYAVVSQDFDSLLFGCTRVVRNLSIEGKRKKASKMQYTRVEPEIISLADVLNTHGIDHDKLIVLGMLVGTDYNFGGIPGIGPAKALKLVQGTNNIAEIFQKVEWNKHCSVDWKEILTLFKEMPVEKNYKLEWKKPDVKKLRTMLIEKHDFSEERVDIKLKKFMVSQTGLERWG
ncbi:flap endonuclease-1 [Candidatus Woesearchaeota archaeon]|nr:flap endonuclease-1 [Candidatus Woesearchaeota archaeon]